MQGVEGQWNGQMTINGKDVPLHPTALNQLMVINSIHQHLPSLTVSFKDIGDRFLASLEIKDGSTVDLVLGDGGNGNTTPMKFNVQGDVTIQGGYGGSTVSFNAILDNLPWVRQIVQGATKGTSADAIQKVAGMAGLSVDMGSVSDAMVWLPNNKPLASFARHVMERGWASATSLMQLAVSDNAVLRYKDIDKLIGQTGRAFGDAGLPILQHMVNSKASLYNNVAGYGSTSTNFSPEGIFKELSKIDVRMLSENLAASAKNIAAIGSLGGRVEPRALDVGNVHEKFFEAMHQNRRGRAMYAHDLHVMVDKLSGVQLLDPANAMVPGYDKRSGQMSSGSYVVTAFTRLLTGNRYLEKVTLTSQSAN